MSSDTCLITRRIEIDMGHRVPNHKSKCRNLHGHRYGIEVGVKGPVQSASNSSDEGMVMDFGDLKDILRREIDAKYDHGFMMYEGDPLADTFKQLTGQKIIYVPFIPTAENFARFLYESLDAEIAALGLSLAFVKIWETPNSVAYYEGGTR
ncbi:MAG: 6-carboxytetrahydropterin synthase QueD [Deltaproteobacteria bacterium]|nr:6-carboxytetrahydropterin synthase QueD [Deltaproteobacteria bacterium]